MVDVRFLSSKRMLGYGTTELRCRQPAAFLAEAGWRTAAARIDQAFPAARHALVLHRVSGSPLARSVVAYARARGLTIIYDIDDLVADDDPSTFAAGIRATMEAADLVTVSTRVLKATADAFHPNAVVVRNGLSHRFLALAEQNRRAEPPREGVTVGYFSGSAGHDEDFAMVAPDLAHLLEARPHVTLAIGGKVNLPEVLAPHGERIRFEPFRPYAEFIALLGTIDVNLAPLDLASPFAAARSEIKVTEAAAFGVPTVASPSTAYRDVIDHGRTGMMCGGHDWFEALVALVDDAALRRRLGEAVRREVLAAYGPDRCVAVWDDLVRRLAARPHRQAYPTLPAGPAIRLCGALTEEVARRTYRERMRPFFRLRWATGTG